MVLLPRTARLLPSEVLTLASRSAACPPVHRTPGTSSRMHTARSKSSTGRHQVTISNDDGRVRWGDLTTGEKVARSTQQSFNFLIIVAGLLATSAVGYVIYSEVLSPEGTTNQYHRALRRIKQDARCVELLGDPKQMVARGEQFHSRMARPWSITSRKEKDRAGNEHLYFRFYIDGPLNTGTVNVHLIQRPGAKEAEYVTLTLDSSGHSRIVLEDNRVSPLTKKPSKILGVRWW